MCCIFRNICCLGLCKDFYRRRKYNLVELAKPAAESPNLATESAQLAVTSIEESQTMATESAQLAATSEEVVEPDATSVEAAKEAETGHTVEAASAAEAVPTLQVSSDPLPAAAVLVVT